MVVGAALLLAGCAGELSTEDKKAAEAYGTKSHHGQTSTSAEALPTKFYSWQELAATAGCTATLQGRAADFRQAACVIDGETFVFLDFNTDKGMRDWLEYAVLYGGIYLVGERWVLSGKSREYMETELLPRLGGRIEEDPHMGLPPDP